MKAALLEQAPGELVIVDDIETDAVGPREVLIKTGAAGVCHSDLHYMEGKYKTRTPTVVGHEAAGVVEAVGSDVSYVKPGDHVVTCLSVFCGTCEYCTSGNPVLCGKRPTRRPRGSSRLKRGGELINQFLDVSAFAEQMLVHENAVAKIDPEIPLDRAALLGCGVTTGLGAVFRTAQVRGGSTVAVVGCGGVGLNVIQGAALAGARKIIAVDMLDDKLETAKSFGATHTVNGSNGDSVDQVKEITGEGGVDYAFEAIGLKPTTEQAFAMLRPAGTAVVVGMIPLGQSVEIPGVDFMFEKRLVGSLMGSNNFRTDMPRYAELYMQGRLKLDELVSARVGLDDVNAAFEEMKKGSVARSVIVFD